MYSTGFLLLVCGIPATAFIAFALMRDRSAHLDRSEAIQLGLSMICVEVLLAAVLLLLAGCLTKRRSNLPTLNVKAQ